MRRERQVDYDRERNMDVRKRLLDTRRVPHYGVMHLETAPPAQHMACEGRGSDPWRGALPVLLAVVTGGLSLLVLHWWPVWGLRLRTRPAALSSATHVIVADLLGQQFVAEVQHKQVDEETLRQLHLQPNDGDEGGHNGDEWRDTVQLHINHEAKPNFRFFVFQNTRHVWSSVTNSFNKLGGVRDGTPCAEIHSLSRGLSPEQQRERRKVFDANIIDVPLKSYLRLLVEEILNPFYIFQIVSISLWMAERYYYYAVCIVVISSVSIGISLYETRKQSVTLRDMVKASVAVFVRRASGAVEKVDSSELVPGDCVLMAASDGGPTLLTFDGALAAGTCIVNESTLTGESVPVTKTPLAQTNAGPYSADEHRRHTLYCGTSVMQTRPGNAGAGDGGDFACAIVTRTGFYTAKGALLAAILHPRPIRFQFYRDAMKFITVLAVLAALGDIYSVVILVRNKSSLWTVVMSALDLVTIVVPPALPAAMTVGQVYAQSRLRRGHRVFCVSPPRINVAGKIKLVCFDKTGTLTEDDLDVLGVVPIESSSPEASSSAAAASAGDVAAFRPLLAEPRRLPPASRLSRALASCHSLALLRGRVIGDPMEVKMVEAVAWTLEDVNPYGPHPPGAVGIMKPPEPGTEAAVLILHQFQFSSKLQRMSVVVTLVGDRRPREAEEGLVVGEGDHGGQLIVFTKGAPETVASLCQVHTVPADFTEMLRHHTQQGFRVLALAGKALAPGTALADAHTLTRVEVEQELCLLGLLVLRNAVKPESAPTIAQLASANIRTVMVTGDNVLTAVSVAGECGMVSRGERLVFLTASPPTSGQPACVRYTPRNDDSHQAAAPISSSPHCHLALNGRSFEVLRRFFPDLVPKVLLRATVYARMSPEQKGQLVEMLQGLDYCVAMCGDGANDCAALRVADVGVSLSEAEASLAAPFTSQARHIGCVPSIIREGRASLVTAFAVFKFMALYSFTQFVSVLILYTVGSNLGDAQFLFIDLFVIVPLAAAMAALGPAPVLSSRRPHGSLLACPVLASVLGQAALQLTVQLSTVFILRAQPWFSPLVPAVAGGRTVPCYENTAVFCVSSFQYVIVAVALSRGRPYRQPIYCNPALVLVLCVLLALELWLTLGPPDAVATLMELKPLPSAAFTGSLAGLAAINAVCSLGLEMLIESGVLGGCVRTLRRKRQPKNRYKRRDAEIGAAQPPWPPLTACTTHSVVSTTLR